MDDLVNWLRAQLDDDERAALIPKTGSNWTYDPATYKVSDTHPIASVMAGAHGEHIARYDPTRVLAEVDAKRQLLDAIVAIKPRTWTHQSFRDGKPGTYRGGRLRDERPALLRLLALPYSDRSGYRPEWGPDA